MRKRITTRKETSPCAVSCGHYAMPNGRCRYHGGLSTGPKNPRVKHGYYTKKSIAERKWLNELLKEVNEIASEMGG